MSKKVFSSPKSKKIFIIIITVFALLVTLVVLEKMHITNFYTKKPPSSSGEDKTTSTAPTAQEDFTDGDDREAGNSLHEDEGNGTVEDQNGASSGSSNSSSWVSSPGGEITSHSPVPNSVIKTGAIISGTSTLPRVNFRLIDNVSGVIAEGSISVVGGNFSGKLNYNTSASEGRIDLYGAKNDGTEYGNVEIPVRFK